MSIQALIICALVAISAAAPQYGYQAPTTPIPVYNPPVQTSPPRTYQPVPTSPPRTYQPVPTEPPRTYQPVPTEPRRTYRPAPTEPPRTYQPVQAPAAPVPSYKPAPSYKAPVQEEPAQYNFNWAVKDDYSGNDFGQDESRDGYNTQGSYYVLLPDGRLQKVSYYVNGDSGFVAEVSYEGEAKYPQPKVTNAYAPPSNSYN